jgi:hypothetical protein
MSKQAKPTTQAERQQAETTLKRMAEEMGVRLLEICVCNGQIDVEMPGNNYFNTSLDSAYLHYLHGKAGTTPPPF